MRRVYCNPLWPSTNQKIQNYLDDQNYAQHRNRIQTAKPAIDNKPPTAYTHLRVKLKKIQLEAERHAKIMEDNIMLLKRMSEILHSKGPLGYQPEPRPKTKSGLKRVSAERNGHLKMFEQTSDHLITKWEKEWQMKLNLISQVTESAKRKTTKPDSELCPRYIKDFGDQTKVLPNINASRISPKKIINLSSASKLTNKEARTSKSAILPRPKAATGARKLIINSKTPQSNDENEIPIILSDQFQKDFPHHFIKKKSDLNNL